MTVSDNSFKKVDRLISNIENHLQSTERNAKDMCARLSKTTVQLKDAEERALEASKLVSTAEKRIKVMLRQESKLKRRLDNLYHKLLAISTSQNPHEVAVSKKHKDSLDYVFFWRAIILNSICIADKEILYRYSNVYLTTTESKISTSPSIVAHGLDVYKPLCMFDLKAKCSDNNCTFQHLRNATDSRNNIVTSSTFHSNIHSIAEDAFKWKSNDYLRHVRFVQKKDYNAMDLDASGRRKGGGGHVIHGQVQGYTTYADWGTRLKHVFDSHRMRLKEEMNGLSGSDRNMPVKLALYLKILSTTSNLFLMKDALVCLSNALDYRYISAGADTPAGKGTEGQRDVEDFENRAEENTCDEENAHDSTLWLAYLSLLSKFIHRHEEASRDSSQVIDFSDTAVRWILHTFPNHFGIHSAARSIVESQYRIKSGKKCHAIGDVSDTMAFFYLVIYYDETEDSTQNLQLSSYSSTFALLSIFSRLLSLCMPEVAMHMLCAILGLDTSLFISSFFSLPMSNFEYTLSTSRIQFKFPQKDSEGHVSGDCNSVTDTEALNGRSNANNLCTAQDIVQAVISYASKKESIFHRDVLWASLIWSALTGESGVALRLLLVEDGTFIVPHTLFRNVLPKLSRFFQICPDVKDDFKHLLFAANVEIIGENICIAAVEAGGDATGASGGETRFMSLEGRKEASFSSAKQCLCYCSVLFSTAAYGFQEGLKIRQVSVLASLLPSEVFYWCIPLHLSSNVSAVSGIFSADSSILITKMLVEGNISLAEYINMCEVIYDEHTLDQYLQIDDVSLSPIYTIEDHSNNQFWKLPEIFFSSSSKLPVELMIFLWIRCIWKAICDESNVCQLFTLGDQEFSFQINLFFRRLICLFFSPNKRTLSNNSYENVLMFLDVYCFLYLKLLHVGKRNSITLTVSLKAEDVCLLVDLIRDVFNEINDMRVSLGLPEFFKTFADDYSLLPTSTHALFSNILKNMVEGNVELCPSLTSSSSHSLITMSILKHILSTFSRIRLFSPDDCLISSIMHHGKLCCKELPGLARHDVEFTELLWECSKSSLSALSPSTIFALGCRLFDTENFEALDMIRSEEVIGNSHVTSGFYRALLDNYCLRCRYNLTGDASHHNSRYTKSFVPEYCNMALSSYSGDLLTRISKILFVSNPTLATSSGVTTTSDASRTTPISTSVELNNFFHSADAVPLSLSLCAISTSTTSVCSVEKVVDTVILQHNQLTMLPSFIGCCSHSLIRLNLAWNALESLPDSLISSLVALQILDISHNQFTVFPTSITKYLFKELVELYIQNNYIQYLSTDMSTMTSLQVLDVSNNGLRVIPSGLTTNKRIKFLRFSGNPAVS